jgi:hypothetical protein
MPATAVAPAAAKIFALILAPLFDDGLGSSMQRRQASVNGVEMSGAAGAEGSCNV